MGNTHVKLGLFVGSSACEIEAQASVLPIAGPAVEQPLEQLTLPLPEPPVHLAESLLAEWAAENVVSPAGWLMASVHRGGGEHMQHWAEHQPAIVQEFIELKFHDLPLEIAVPRPERVGMDRLVAALAAAKLKPTKCPALIVDQGTAITVDLVDVRGRFCGGAILPGMALSSRALAEGTDALPDIAWEQSEEMPEPVGKVTEAAIAAGIAWGTLGAVAELVRQIAARQDVPPVVFVTGGGGEQLTAQLQKACALSISHRPHLVLSGIAVAGRAGSQSRS